MLQTASKGPQDVDINDQLRSLKESDVQVTFTDIYRDYKMFRRAYYYHMVVDTEKIMYKTNETNEKGEVPVDIENF